VPRLFEQALALHQWGQLAAARRIYEQIVAAEPTHEVAWFWLGTVEMQAGEVEKGIERIDRSLTLNPAQPEALTVAGHGLRLLGRPTEALIRLERALQLDPRNLLALTHRGSVLMELGQRPAALDSYARAVRLNPAFPLALLQYGKALIEEHQWTRALQLLDRCIALFPQGAEAFHERGRALTELQRPAEALQSYERALELEPTSALTRFKRAVLLTELDRHEAAAAAFTDLLILAPDYPCALGGLQWSKLMLCDWQHWEENTERLISAVDRSAQATNPFTLLTVSDSPSRQLRRARDWVSGFYSPAQNALWNGERYRHPRIRLAYLSANFGNHPVSALMARVFESHDRTRFETFAISLAPRESTPMGQRVAQAFDHFIDVSVTSDTAAAALIREREIDIVVDLMGFTARSRTGILAQRAAPVQVNYLGFPATMGTPYIDYLIADRFTIPDPQRSDYQESVVRLPDCFQANDNRRVQGRDPPRRSSLGLPEKGIVFCCFNNTYKINPPCFDSWMRILWAVPESVLWLLADAPRAREHLQREASCRHVSSDRLVFAERVAYDEYLSRLCAADLFLDTVPFNAGTTASDALWCGLPVLTCSGVALAARMAGSLLTACGLREMITYSMADYEATAIRWAQAPQALAALRRRLNDERSTAPLFDSERFRWHLETAYVHMWQRAEDGEVATGFDVEALAR
jgi:predicted O-linked N-acetylglucosamine transferase (SPINDLY family)